MLWRALKRVLLRKKATRPEPTDSPPAVVEEAPEVEFRPQVRKRKRPAKQKHDPPPRASQAECDVCVTLPYLTNLSSWGKDPNILTIYDSDVDEFTDAETFQRIFNRRNIAVVGFTADGDVFGGFYHTVVTKRKRQFFDANVFIFSFESHGRCETPQRFLPKDTNQACVVFYVNDSDLCFVNFCVWGFGGVELGNERSRVCCSHLSDAFEGIEDRTLNGKESYRYFECSRLIILQMFRPGVL